MTVATCSSAGIGALCVDVIDQAVTAAATAMYMKAPLNGRAVKTQSLVASSEFSFFVIVFLRIWSR
ncbi:hypothetical protein BN77_p11597 [Rhizobium mesoamericanum STM3625]|uniref:Uncharacterized protein n=1 Tax=Rhizobium mesoamericanum STM3625 TaxID=1211777 RepID=K0PQI2_9HYPH|nr:hypothetical protein BN77_p11597 [Rhizobium mesoamericanum STM3625]